MTSSAGAFLKQLLIPEDVRVGVDTYFMLLCFAFLVGLIVILQDFCSSHQEHFSLLLFFWTVFLILADWQLLQLLLVLTLRLEHLLQALKLAMFDQVHRIWSRITLFVNDLTTRACSELHAVADQVQLGV